jgi:2,3-bisphosphoglycerate-dependent phosphoglycerate mutase
MIKISNSKFPHRGVRATVATGLFIILSLSIILLNSCTTNFFIVRHAEKSTTPKDDPILTEAGTARAEKLKTILESKNIEEIYSTNTTRTKSTANPLVQKIQKEIQIYDAKNQTEFIEKLKKSKKNTLVVGHSNTIRFVINGLGETEFLKADLTESEYDNIFIVKRGSGKPKVERVKF